MTRPCIWKEAKLRSEPKLDSKAPARFPELHASFRLFPLLHFNSLSAVKVWTESLHLLLEPHSGSALSTDAALSSQREKERAAEGMSGKWTIPVAHPGELSTSVTCLTGLLLPAGPGLYKLARKSQGTPDVTPGFILKYHQPSPRQHTVFNMKSKYRILKVVAESDHCSGIAVTDTCGKFPK